jgi:hypothetical protein
MFRPSFLWTAAWRICKAGGRLHRPKTHTIQRISDTKPVNAISRTEPNVLRDAVEWTAVDSTGWGALP